MGSSYIEHKTLWRARLLVRITNTGNSWVPLIFKNELYIWTKTARASNVHWNTVILLTKQMYDLPPIIKIIWPSSFHYLQASHWLSEIFRNLCNYTFDVCFSWILHVYWFTWILIIQWSNHNLIFHEHWWFWYLYIRFDKLFKTNIWCILFDNLYSHQRDPPSQSYNCDYEWYLCVFQREKWWTVLKKHCLVAS